MKKLKMTIAMCLATVMVMSMMCVGVLADEKNTNRSYTELFGNKELLSYFLLTDDLKMQGDLERFIIELDVSDEELTALYDIAQQERENASLYSQNLLTDEELADKYSEIDTALDNLLDNYAEYKEWIADWYVEDIEYRNDYAEFVRMQDARSGVNRRYYVFATQFSHTSQGVALPDKYIKFANLGWHSDIPENVRQYYYNTPYTVNLYNPSNDKTVLNAPVVDSGPWNIDDSYWNPAYERRMFSDLPQGKPEAQAAYQDGYNSGKDQYGRTVLNPAGIDLTSNMSSQLGMGSGNAWIYVRFDNLPQIGRIDGMRKWTLILLTMVVLTSVVCSCGRNNADKENGNNWIDVSYSENYFEEVLIKYDEGHFPWRNDKYEVAKEFLVSDKIDDRILGDVNMIEEKNDSYVFETEDNKKIEVHIMKPFSDAEIYFVDKYRYLFVAES